MGIAELIDQRPKTVLASLSVAALVAAAIAINGWGKAGARLPVIPNRASYTTDDGATLFTDAADRIVPFDHGCRQAVRAYVFAGSSGHRWVQYLQKFSEAGRAQREEREKAKAAGSTPEMQSGVSFADLLVKRPGDAEWTACSNPAANSIMEPKDPNGGNPKDIAVVNP